VRQAVGSVLSADLLPLGAHQSIAGGTPRAVERGVSAGCRVVQIFVKNNNRWVGKTIGEVEAREFRLAARRAAFAHVAAHTSYLINLASPSLELRRQSVAALADEILRCHALGIRDLVLHPGSHGGDGEAAGVARVASSLDETFRATGEADVRVLLETAAGQGTAVGHRFEHLRDILGAVRQNRRVAVCLDTCHVHAAGYELSSRDGYAETLLAFERTIGLQNLAAIHVNDSKKPKGSRVDRHEHIGRGWIGRKGFRNLMTDPRLIAIPKILETPKDETLDLDRRNLATLRRLAGSPSPPRRSARSLPSPYSSAGGSRRPRPAGRSEGLPEQ
jgi:deoxyribonuclease-4